MSRIVRSFGVVAMGAQLVELMGLLKEAYKHHVSHHEITTAVTLLEQFHKTFASLCRLFVVCVCQYGQQSVWRCQLVPANHNGIV